MTNAIHDLDLDCDLLLYQTDLEAHGGERDRSDKRYVQEPPIAADEPVPRVVIAVMTGLRLLAVFRLFFSWRARQTCGGK